MYVFNRRVDPLVISAMMTIGLVSIGILSACDDEPDVDDPVEQPEANPPQPTEPNEPDPDPLAGLDDIEALENEATDPSVPSASAQTVQAAAPPRGCATFAEEPMRIYPRTGPANVVAVGGDGFVVAGYANKESGPGEEIWVVRAKPGQAQRLLLRDDLAQPLSVGRTAAPGLGVVDDGHVGVVTIDGGADVRTTVVQTGGRVEAWRRTGTRADQRFTPAFATRGDRQVVAYTEGSSDGMKVHVVGFEPTGREVLRHDITPEAMGATAATFIDGADELLFIDPHEAVSPLHLANVTSSPPTETVLLPLSNIFEPVALAAVRVGDRTLVGYTAMGMAAATAVGLVAIRGDQSQGPIPIVPSSGYGMLHVSGAASHSRAVFVADRPKAREREAPREVIAIVAEPTETAVSLGAPKVLTTPDGTARWGRIARHRDGTYAVVLTGADGVYLHFMRCDEGEPRLQ